MRIDVRPGPRPLGVLHRPFRRPQRLRIRPSDRRFLRKATPTRTSTATPSSKPPQTDGELFHAKIWTMAPARYVHPFREGGETTDLSPSSVVSALPDHSGLFPRSCLPCEPSSTYLPQASAVRALRRALLAMLIRPDIQRLRTASCRPTPALSFRLIRLTPSERDSGKIRREHVRRVPQQRLAFGARLG